MQRLIGVTHFGTWPLPVEHEAGSWLFVIATNTIVVGTNPTIATTTVAHTTRASQPRRLCLYCVQTVIIVGPNPPRSSGLCKFIRCGPGTEFIDLFETDFER